MFDKAVLDGSSEKIQKETSTLHGVEVRDYLGRGYLYPPQDINVDLRGMYRLSSITIEIVVEITVVDFNAIIIRDYSRDYDRNRNQYYYQNPNHKQQYT